MLIQLGRTYDLFGNFGPHLCSYSLMVLGAFHLASTNLHVLAQPSRTQSNPFTTQNPAKKPFFVMFLRKFACNPNQKLHLKTNSAYFNRFFLFFYSSEYSSSSFLSFFHFSSIKPEKRIAWQLGARNELPHHLLHLPIACFFQRTPTTLHWSQ